MWISINTFYVFFSDKCHDPCEEVSCPDPHSECKVTDHEARCRCKEGYQEVQDSDSTVDCGSSIGHISICGLDNQTTHISLTIVRSENHCNAIV